MSLRCYMLELIMVMGEEEILDNDTDCIHDFNDTLPKVNPVSPVYEILLGSISKKEILIIFNDLPFLHND